MDSFFWPLTDAGHDFHCLHAFHVLQRLMIIKIMLLAGHVHVIPSTQLFKGQTSHTQLPLCYLARRNVVETFFQSLCSSVLCPGAQCLTLVLSAPKGEWSCSSCAELYVWTARLRLMVWSLTLQKCLDWVEIYACTCLCWNTRPIAHTHTLLACRDTDFGHTRKGLNSVPTKGITRTYIKGARVGVIIPWWEGGWRLRLPLWYSACGATFLIVIN